MDQGLITNPKDLERMQGELVSLQRRISDLEDTELEVMERLETAQARARPARRPSSSRWTAAPPSSATTRDEKAGRLDAELRRSPRERKTLADGLPADLRHALRQAARSRRAASGPRRCGPVAAAAAPWS